ncbi:MAG: response regulator transcription factor [Rikenellaceae bacterium]
MSTNRELSVVIADDHTLFRGGLKLLINSNPRFKVVADLANGQELLDFLSQQSVDIILLDIAMPVMDGVKAASKITKLYPETPIITLSMYGEGEYYFKMLSLGVKGFILKNSDINEVFDALNCVAEGGSYFSSELLDNLMVNLRISTLAPPCLSTEEILSRRESEILLEVCRGLSNQEIGDKLFISKRTVDKHRANILLKTGCKNTAHLVMFAIKNKLIVM